MIVGALAGLCLLIAVAVADLTIRTSAELDRQGQGQQGTLPVNE
ncbi:MAG: hypothetical protein AAGA70_09565 [Pseudomonadota bacterium]